jgi:hypothetical protein
MAMMLQLMATLAGRHLSNLYRYGAFLELSRLLNLGDHALCSG